MVIKIADRQYRQSLGLLQALQNAQYTDNSPISFGESIPYINIANWDDVKTVDKTSINTLALANGYTVES